jgi:DNA invertase Pin-like site-specific DNA recombinase
MKFYARVSTDDKGQSTENQLIRLRQWAKDKGIKDFKEYSDRQSGKSLKRPQFIQLMSELETNDTIVLTTFDRYSRTVADAMSSIEDVLSKGHKIMFVDSGISLEIYPIPEDVWLILQMQFTMAEYFRRHLSTNTKAGIQRKRIETGRWGKQTALEKTGLTVKYIISLYDKGFTMRRIQELTGISRSTIQRIITSHSDKEI